MSRQWLLSLTVALAASPFCAADEAKIVPREILEKIVDDDPNPLPRYMTPAEAKLPLAARPGASTRPRSTTSTRACSSAGAPTTTRSPR